MPHTPTASSSLPVEVLDLTKSFGSAPSPVVALQGVSLQVRRGEMVAIIGASGSGKSTLLHLIAGLATPTSRQIKIDGEDLGTMNDRQITLFRRHHLGLVFQAFNLIPTLSVEDNIQLPLLMETGGRHQKDRLESLLETLGLQNRRHHRPDQLSGGEQQRVAIDARW